MLSKFVAKGNQNLFVVECCFDIVQTAGATILKFNDRFRSPFLNVPHCPSKQNSTIFVKFRNMFEGPHQLTDDFEERMPLSSAMPSTALKSAVFIAATVVKHAQQQKTAKFVE